MPRVAFPLLLLAALLVPSAAVAAPARTTHSVPVTSADEYGSAVTLEVDVYLPDGPVPGTGFPLVYMFHGGGSDKDNEYDAARAKRFAAHGYAAILYSARGHGASRGQVTVAGPKEIRDAFDVLHWAFDVQKLPLDRGAIALWGISQGGLHTNLVQVWADDPDVNPYGFRFVAMQPGNTPDRVFEALVDHEVVKLSFGIGLIGTYFGGTQGKVAPIVDKWIAATMADRPELYGGDVCDATGHDAATSTMKADLAWRSVACRSGRMTLPTYWMQAFDDELFPANMAAAMVPRMSDGRNRLYLSMGGHGAPAAFKAVEDEKIGLQIAFLDHVVRGAPFNEPRVVYWTRDLGVTVPAGTNPWPEGSWYRQTAGAWPPAGTSGRSLALGVDGRALADASAAQAGPVPLGAPEPDPASDQVVATALGTTPPAAPAAPPGSAMEFAAEPAADDVEISGMPTARLRWTPGSTDSQVVLKLFAEAPDGTRTLISRGVAGLRGATPGQAVDVAIEAQAISVRLPRGHRVVARIAAGDATFYKAYPGSTGGVLGAGPDSTVTLPVRLAGGPAPVRRRRCVDRLAPRTTVTSARVRGGRLRVTGRSRDRACRGAPRRVTRVLVAVRMRSGKRCRYLTDAGTLTATRRCGRRRWLEPTGAARWRLSVPAGRLAPGRYEILVQSADVRGNVERPRVRRRVRVR